MAWHGQFSTTFHCKHSCISFEQIAGKGKKQLTFNQIELGEASPYAAEDADSNTASA